MNSIHGHEVMHMMLESDKPFTEATLVQTIKDQFGDDTKFHTCSAQDMSAEQLVALLKSKGKFVEVEGGFTAHDSRICQH